MTMKKKLASVLVVLGLMAGSAAIAANVSKARHPNLNHAQKDIESAVGYISKAQTANEFDMDGHAAKAKELLGQAYDEVKLAAEAANKNGH
jgi:hypothetical protein